MAQIKNYQQLELLSTNFIRRDETDPLTVASLSVIGSTSGIDHGDLDGLGDDDHSQYLNTTRHDTTTRHTLGTVVPHDDHGLLSGLGDDDHNGATYGYILREPNNNVSDNAIVRWDGVGGRNVKNSANAILEDGGNLTLNGDLIVDNDGTTKTLIGRNYIELGYDGVTGGESYIDLWGGGSNTDYDARIHVNGGTASAGYGAMTITARNGIDLIATSDEVYVDGNLDVSTSYNRYHGTYVGYIYHPLSSNTILLSLTNSGTVTNQQIDVSTKGLPSTIKAINLKVVCRDSGSAANDTYIEIYQTSSGGGATISFSPMPVNDRYGRYGGIMNCGSNGDIWYSIAASGTSTFDVTVECLGYWI